MKIHLKLDGKVIAATLADSEAAHTFAAMLPLTITMHALFGREKFGALPGPMPHAATCTQDCGPGDIICWTAGPDLAVFHGHERKAVTGGFHVLGKIDAATDAFAAAGPLEVTIEQSTHREADGDGGEGRGPPSAHLAAGCDRTHAASSRDSASVIRG
ncbi:hypothetical protein BH10PSE18_BH10PSE18_38350 [soil metagenome]